MKLAASHIAWRVLIKCAEIDDPVKKIIRTVARKRGFQMPTDRDFARMFPNNWEDQYRRQGRNPSWQTHFEESQWLKDQVNRQSGSGGPRPGSAPRAGGSGVWSNLTVEDKIQMGMMAAAILGTAAYAYYNYRKDKAEAEARKKARREHQERQ